MWIDAARWLRLPAILGLLVARVAAAPDPGTAPAEPVPVVVQIGSLTIDNPTIGPALSARELEDYVFPKAETGALILLRGANPDTVRTSDYLLSCSARWLDQGESGSKLELRFQLSRVGDKEIVKLTTSSPLTLEETPGFAADFLQGLRGGFRVVAEGFAGSSVRVDGNSVGSTPFEVHDLLLGTHQVEVSHPRAVGETKQAVVQSAAVEEVRVDMAERPTTLKIRVSGKSSHVFLDGKELQDTYTTRKQEVLTLRIRPQHGGPTLRKRLALEKYQDYVVDVDMPAGTVYGPQVPRVLGPHRPFAFHAVDWGIGYEWARPENLTLHSLVTGVHTVSMHLNFSFGWISFDTQGFYGIPHSNHRGLVFLDAAGQPQEISSLRRYGGAGEVRLILPFARRGDRPIYPLIGLGYTYGYWDARTKYTWVANDGSPHSEPILLAVKHPYVATGLNLGKWTIVFRRSLHDPDGNWMQLGFVWFPAERRWEE